MRKIVVTTDKTFTDIDGLSCVIAYTELLKMEGKKPTAVIPAPFNKSVTKDIQKWDFKFKRDVKNKNVKFVIVDRSNPEQFPDFVKEDSVVEIFDHRTGFENYWKSRLGKKAIIEMIGACATLVWEEYVKRARPLTISTTSANLLYTTICSHTLNFNASITTKRDIKAFKDLEKYIKLPKNWIKKYFEEQEKQAQENPIETIINDTKATDDKLFIGQLELWDSKEFISRHTKEIEKALESFNSPKWFLTSPSISEGKNYVYTKNEKMKKFLSKSIGAKFKGNIGTTKKLWLRKEILKKLQEK